VEKIRAHQTLKELKVIVFSSLINEHMAKKCATAGADAWTTKPNMADLVDLIDEHILSKNQ
jgi:two-component system chemotaxis response regulator CheV